MTAPHRVDTIGIIGAGKSGVAIARLAIAAGYTVKIASSGTARDTALMTGIVAPGAIAVDVPEAMSNADLVILAVPLRRFRYLPLHLLDGRTVINVMNYWPPIDGTLPEFDVDGRPSSAVVQDALPATATLVKTFNHLGYHQMDDLPRPAGDTERIALGIASDDDEAAALVADFVDTVGFAPVMIGALKHSTVLQPETPLFGAAISQETFAQQAGTLST